jgi:hypothetical protein
VVNLVISKQALSWTGRVEAGLHIQIGITLQGRKLDCNIAIVQFWDI